MNPYERRIIHSAIGKMEGVRSESKGEGRDRRVVIYSTAPDAQTENTYGERRPRGGRGNGRRPGGSRNGGYRGGNRSEHGDHNGNRGGYRGSRNGAPRGPRPSGVPERTYAPRDAENAAPVAPKRTERVDDFADFSFGKIELCHCNSPRRGRHRRGAPVRCGELCRGSAGVPPGKPGKKVAQAKGYTALFGHFVDGGERL